MTGQRRMHGTRKPPSMTVPLLCGTACAAHRASEEFGAVVGAEDDDGGVVQAKVLELLHHQTDVVIELGQRLLLPDQPFSELRIFSYFIKKDALRCACARVKPAEERLVVSLRLLYERQGEVANFVIHSFHRSG